MSVVPTAFNVCTGPVPRANEPVNELKGEGCIHAQTACFWRRCRAAAGSSFKTRSHLIEIREAHDFGFCRSGVETAAPDKAERRIMFSIRITVCIVAITISICGGIVAAQTPAPPAQGPRAGGRGG